MSRHSRQELTQCLLMDSTCTRISCLRRDSACCVEDRSSVLRTMSCASASLMATANVAPPIRSLHGVYPWRLFRLEGTVPIRARSSAMYVNTSA